MIRRRLALFAEIAKGFIDIDRLKLILFASGAKPATFVALKVNSDNLTDKYHFEERIKHFVFVESRARSFEEISQIKDNKVIWNFKGVWIGYDLFQDKNRLDMFKKYVTHVRRQEHEKADRLGGLLYSYPSCCVESFIKEHNPEYIRKNYSCHEYYKRQHDCERKFPFVVHTPCSINCKETAKLNNEYKKIVKRLAPKFYKDFSSKKSYSTKLIVDAESDVLGRNGKTIWPEKDGHEYSLIAKTPFKGHHYLYAYLAKCSYARGTVLDAKVVMQHNYADITVRKVEGAIKGLHHERKFLVAGRKF